MDKNKCDHIIGIVYDYDCTRLLRSSGDDNIYNKVEDNDINRFKLCPECGERLNEK